MAYGLIYNLNFASNIGDRKHRLSIYKDGHTATITTSDNNVIGTEEPVVVIWDNTDDIYNNIMGSRCEMSFYSDATKQIDVADILSSTSASAYKVIYSLENELGTLVPYWEGYINNATFEQGISSTPTVYRLIATDMLGTLKNVTPIDGSAVIDSKPTVMQFLDNVLGFLPYNQTFKVSNKFELKPYQPNTNIPTYFTKMHNLQWVSPFTSGMAFIKDSAYEFIENTLKAFNSRLFWADSKWYVINNCSYDDTAAFDTYDTSGVYSSTASENVVKVIPTNLKPINNDLRVRYDTPYDVVNVNIGNYPYATQFDINHVAADVNNLSPYPSFETKVNGILLNGADYSDDFSATTERAVKVGNYSIKTTNYITSGTPTQKIMDTGYQGAFQTNQLATMYFHASYKLTLTGSDEYNTTIYYSLLRETASNDTGTTGLARSYYNGSSWVGYSSESEATKLAYNNSTTPAEEWVDIIAPVNDTGTQIFARYRVILWQPKLGSIATVVFHFDQVFISRRNVLDFFQPVKTISKLTSSTRRTKKLNYEFDSYYPIGYILGAQVKIGTSIVPNYLAQLNEVISKQILNDNRTHIKRYTVTCTPVDNDEIIYPYHKIDLGFTGYTTSEAGIIDRMKYSAKSNLYELEFHETNQSTNANVTVTIT